MLKPCAHKGYLSSSSRAPRCSVFLVRCRKTVLHSVNQRRVFVLISCSLGPSPQEMPLRKPAYISVSWPDPAHRSTPPRPPFTWVPIYTAQQYTRCDLVGFSVDLFTIGMSLVKKVSAHDCKPWRKHQFLYYLKGNNVEIIWDDGT